LSSSHHQSVPATH